jgi:hypothetical protein
MLPVHAGVLPALEDPAVDPDAEPFEVTLVSPDGAELAPARAVHAAVHNPAALWSIFLQMISGDGVDALLDRASDPATGSRRDHRPAALPMGEGVIGTAAEAARIPPAAARIDFQDRIKLRVAQPRASCQPGGEVTARRHPERPDPT